jgi:hypothetical protein
MTEENIGIVRELRTHQECTRQDAKVVIKILKDKNVTVMDKLAMLFAFSTNDRFLETFLDRKPEVDYWIIKNLKDLNEGNENYEEDRSLLYKAIANEWLKETT